MPAGSAAAGLRSSVLVVPDVLLAASLVDWIERGTPVVLLAFALSLAAVRRRDRRRGADDLDR